MFAANLDMFSRARFRHDEPIEQRARELARPHSVRDLVRKLEFLAGRPICKMILHRSARASESAGNGRNARNRRRYQRRCTFRKSPRLSGTFRWIGRQMVVSTAGT